MAKFSDISKFTKSAPYATDVPWDHIERNLERYADASTDLQLDPEFQRAHVWDEAKQRRYVEYILRGGKSSTDIYFNHSNWMNSFKGPMYLVDGKQRLEAVRKFMRNELPIFGNNKLNDFEDNLPVFSVYFRFHINDLKTYPEILQWYLDLNDGGVVHTQEELDKVRLMLEKENAK